MLEFYQAYATYQTLMDQAEALLRHVDRCLRDSMTALGRGAVYESWVKGRKFSLGEPFVRVPMREAAAAALVRAELPEQVLASLEQLAKTEGQPDAARLEADGWVRQWAKASDRASQIDWGNLRRALGKCGSGGERLFVAYEYLAEPFLTEDYRTEDQAHSVPVFVTDHPLAVSPLARKKQADPTLTDRFELFVDGIELCNAFSELNDPDDQAARFEEQVAKKQSGQDETMDYDEDYVRALQHGMPPAAGFGMGVDRLLVALTNSGSIRDVIAFPLLKPEKASG
jgi:lysyl-tRNA synthetase class 2